MAIFNINADYDFLRSLHKFAIENYGDNPIIMSNITILLPSRRSCNRLKHIFLEGSGKKSLLLPKILAIGDIDYDDLLPSSMELGDLQEFNNVTKPVSQFKYKMLLLKEILAWARSNPARAGNTFRHMNLEQAKSLALELDKLLGEVKKNGVSLDSLNDLVDGEYSQHWEEILYFLQNFGTRWNRILEDGNIVSSYEYRMEMIGLNTKILSRKPPKNPILVCGVTGEVRAAAELIKTISHYENCHIIMKDVDIKMDGNIWEILRESHPQFGHKKLLEYLGIERTNIKPIEFPEFLTSRSSLAIDEALLPPEITHLWGKSPDTPDIGNIRKIECRDNINELETVANIVRDHVEDKNIAVLTTDENFAHQLEIMLKRWNICGNNAFGNKFASTNTVRFLFLLMKNVTDGFQPIDIIALFRHTLFSGPKDLHDLSILFEDNLLRDRAVGFGLGHYRKILSTIGDNGVRGRHKLHNRNDCLGRLGAFLEYLENVFAPLTSLKDGDFDDLLKKHLGVAETIAGDALWADEGYGDDLLELFRTIISETKEYGNITMDDYPALLDYFIAGNSYSRRYETNSRVSIISPHEARLLNYDLVIMSGMNDDSWPGLMVVDPWMSNSMRLKMGLPSRQEATGASCFDFRQFLCQKDVIFTRALKDKGTETVKSRFIMRLETCLACYGIKIPTAEIYTKVAQHKLNNMGAIKISRPKPSPPLSIRPKVLSATDIETINKDPYQIYAKKILCLYREGDIAGNFEYSIFGNAIHRILEEFVNNYDTLEDKAEGLMGYGNKFFDEYFLNPVDRELWWPRFENIAKFVLEQEEKAREAKRQIFAERRGSYRLSGRDFTIVAKADRIELSPEGSVKIIDYKTGTVPSPSDVRSLKKPQLAIEALIMAKGNFGLPKNPTEIEDPEFWKLQGKNNSDKIIAISSNSERTISTGELIQKCEDLVVALVIHFNEELEPYISTQSDLAERHRSDYNHLSRVDEWGYI